MTGSSYEYVCPECGAVNTIASVVVEVCAEHWTFCGECDNRVAFNLSGEP